MKKNIILVLFIMCMIFIKQDVYAFSNTYEKNIIELEKEYTINSLVDDWGYILQMEIPESGRIRIWIKDYTNDFCDNDLYISDVGNASFEELEGFESREWNKGAESMHSGWITVNKGAYVSKFHVSGSVNSEAILYIEYEKQSEYYGESENNDTFDNATIMTLGKKYEGNNSKLNDKDYYKFVLDAQGLVKFSSRNIRNNSLMYCHIYSEDNNGNVKEVYKNYYISELDGRNWEWDCLRLPKGTYFVEVFNGTWEPEYSIQVNYTKENEKEYEHEDNNVSKNANKRELKQKIKGNLNNDSDQDYFKFTVPVDSYVSLESWIPRQLANNILEVSIYDSKLNLLDSVSSTSNPYMKIEDVLVKKGNFYVLIKGTKDFYNIYDYTIKADAVCCKHNYRQEVIKQATTKKNGKIKNICKVCDYVSEEKISKIKTVKLSATEYVYNKKTKKPSVKVLDSDGKKIKSNNYSITYAKGRKNIGIYEVKVQFKGKYKGTVIKKFEIQPKSTKITGIVVKSNQMTVKWKKQNVQTTGYEIQYSTSNKFTKKATKTVIVKSKNTTSKKIGKLKLGKTYYVKVRTYKIVKQAGKTVKVYSSWSKVKEVVTNM